MRRRPSLVATLVLGTLAVLFAWLGTWQLERAALKHDRLALFNAAPTLAALPRAGGDSLFARVRLRGHADPERHFLVDNQILDGRAGVHVLTPFRLDDGTLLLVNRGWLAAPGGRTTLPLIPTPGGEVEWAGHLEGLRTPGLRLGDPEVLQSGDWPQRVTFPEMEQLAEALGEQPFPLVLYLAADSRGGFDGRDWSPVFMGPAKHRAYAVQWFALSVTAFAAWAALCFRRSPG